MKVTNIKEAVGKRLMGGSLPDIDTDFDSTRRGEVKTYMENRFGKDQVSSVGTFTTLQLKGALKDLDRVLGGKASLANIITGMIDKDDSTMLDLYKRSTKEPKLKEFIKTNSDLFHYMPSLLGQQKSLSIHPCAIIISPYVMKSQEWFPVREQNGLIVAEWSGEDMDDAGFLKQDVLGLKELGSFSRIEKMVVKNNKEFVDIYDLPHDNEVFRYFSNGWNGNIFQVGTDSLSAYTKALKPDNIEDLIATIALYRPGAMENNYHNLYVDIKNKGKKPKYLWGTEKITADTNGIMIMQEQVMQAFTEIGGLTLLEADDVRRAMGKKNVEYMASYKDRVNDGYLSKGASQADFEESWEAFVEFAKYSFNRCLSGKTVIKRVDRCNISVEELYENDVFGYGESYSLSNGKMIVNKIVDVRYEGVKEVFKMTLSNGSFVDATNNHKFPTSNGEKRLDKININKDLIHSYSNGVLEKLSIVSIKSNGFEDVYDVEMAEPNHTFTLNNGIVTCNSHSVCYADTGYIGQYLKVEYPLEFWTDALTQADEKKGEYSKYLSEIFEAKGINVRPPDINGSEIAMTSNFDTNTIFWGIGSIKGIGEATAEQILNERSKNGDYVNLNNFIARHTFTGSKVKKQVFEALISSGAFDLLHNVGEDVQERNGLITDFRELKKVKISNVKRDIYTNGQLSKGWWWRLQQKKLTGLAFFDYKQLSKDNGFDSQYCSNKDLTQVQHKGVFRTFAGYVIELKTRTSSRGKFAFILIESNYKIYKLIVWSQQYEDSKDLIALSENSLIVFDAELRFNADYDKKNVFTLQDHSKLIILK